MNFLFHLKIREMQKGYKFAPEKMFTGIRSDFFFKFCLIPGGKYLTVGYRVNVNNNIIWF